MSAASFKAKAPITAVRDQRNRDAKNMASLKAGVRAAAGADSLQIADRKAGSGMTKANLRAIRAAITAAKAPNMRGKTVVTKMKVAAGNPPTGAGKTGNATNKASSKVAIIAVKAPNTERRTADTGAKAGRAANNGDRVLRVLRVRKDGAEMTKVNPEAVTKAAIVAANARKGAVRKMREAIIAGRGVTTNGARKKIKTGTASKIPAANPATTKTSPIAAGAVPRFMMTKTVKTGGTLKMIPTRLRTTIIPVRAALVSGNRPIPVGE
jgi:hypothetical protein